MTVIVRYFAAARELAGVGEEPVALPSGAVTGEAFLAILGERHPRLAAFAGRMRLAINGDFAARDARVKDGDAVDVLPPVAGGSGVPDAVALVEVRGTALSIDECFEAVRHPGAGGVAVFVGIVRDRAEGQDVARLDYEAHPELAVVEMRRVLESVVRDHAGARLAATHRVGPLAIGDLAVVVAASAPHRAEAFAACRAAIDRIKETVPIWKKEWGPDGSAIWVNLAGEGRGGA